MFRVNFDVTSTNRTDNQFIVSSAIVAEIFDREHKHVLESIRKSFGCDSEKKFKKCATYCNSNNNLTSVNSNYPPNELKYLNDKCVKEMDRMCYITREEDTQGKMRTIYYINREEFIKICSRFKNPKAEKIFDTYIGKFSEMERHIANLNERLQDYILNRAESQQSRDDWMKACEEYGFTYRQKQNLTDDLYYAVLGMRAINIRKVKRLPNCINVREYGFEGKELEMVIRYERMQTTWIRMGYSYPEIKLLLREQIERDKEKGIYTKLEIVK